MEEKKLTDEEIVKALECCAMISVNPYLRGECIDCPYFQKHIDCVEGKRSERDFIDLIHRLQRAIEGLTTENKVLHKENNELIEKIERLTEVRKDFRQEVITLNNEKRELQKQLDELTEELEKAYEIERANIHAEIAEAGTSCHWCQAKTEKDTAKEILQGFDKWLKQAISDSYDKSVKGSLHFGGKNSAFHEVKELVKKVAERKGVEVE